VFSLERIVGQIDQTLGLAAALVTQYYLDHKLSTPSCSRWVYGYYTIENRKIQAVPALIFPNRFFVGMQDFTERHRI
jgi:hypothetical protein